MNHISMTGRITANPELKRTQSGLSVCTFTLAVKRPKVKDTTDFLSCVAWRQAAEYLATYGHKGDMVAVTGCLTARKWQDKDGNYHTAFETVCDSVELMTSRANSEGGQVSGAQTTGAQQIAAQQPAVYRTDAQPHFEDVPTDGDLPF